MVKPRKSCLTTMKFAFVYGCAPHAIHNLCMDFIKHFNGVKRVLKQFLFMIKFLKSIHFLLQFFDKLCMEKYQKTYVLILFTKTRWGTVFVTAQRDSTVKTSCAVLPGEIMNSDCDLQMSDELKSLLTDQRFWKAVAAMETLFKTISSCIIYLEGDEATFSSVYACFVAIKFKIKTLNFAVMNALDLSDSYIEQMLTLIDHRFSTIYSASHCLEF